MNNTHLSQSVPDSTQLISKRYAPNARSYICLNEHQEKTRQQVLDKITNGTYQLSSQACQLCGSDNFVTIAERDRYSLPVRTCICRQCGLLMTNPLMRGQDYADFYQNHYTSLYDGFQYSPTEFFSNQQAAGKRLHDVVGNYVDLKNLRVAEVGCAAGGILYYFSGFCKEVVGCDYGTDFMTYGKTRGLKLLVGGVETLREERPDVIIYSHVLEHIYDVNNELRTVADILPSEGLLIVDVPGLFNVRTSYESDFLKYLQNAHLMHFTAETLTALTSKHGFSKVYVDERCIGIFRKTTTTKSPKVIVDGAHLKTMEFLLRTEKVRTLVKAKLLPRKALVLMAKLLGIYKVLRRVYHGLPDL
jgi:2-polyprenyl-3-methyl-5-hydroxy-6-metoxy-1,4-benzoquinol methylase